MKKSDTKSIKDALQLEQEIYELTRGKSLVCPTGKRSHTKANVLKQEYMSGTLGVCIKCGKPLIPPAMRTRRSWVDLTTELIEIEESGALLRADGSGAPEPEEEVAALAAHLVHHEGVELARVEAAVDRGDLEARWARQCALIRQQRDFVGILYRDTQASPQVRHSAPVQQARPCQPPVHPEAERELLEALNRLMPSQFGLWVFHVGISAEHLLGDGASQSQRAITAVGILSREGRIDEGRREAGLPAFTKTQSPVNIGTMNVNGGVGLVFGGGKK